MKRRRLRAYLSGGMEYADGRAADWRTDLEAWIRKELRHGVYNPIRKTDAFLRRRRIRTRLRILKEKDFQLYLTLVRAIVMIDCRELAHETDYVVCFWDESAQRGAGTQGEVSIARLFDKPVYLVSRMEPTEIPGWVLGCASAHFSTFDELKNHLRTKYASWTYAHSISRNAKIASRLPGHS